MVSLYMVTIVTSGVACCGSDGMCDNIVSQQITNECVYLSPVPPAAVRWNADLVGLGLILVMHEEENNRTSCTCSCESQAGM